MVEPSGKGLGVALGGLAVGVGVLATGVGLACLLRDQPLEGVDGLVLGGLALLAGWVILARRRQ